MPMRKNSKKIHEPVLVHEVIKALGLKNLALLKNQARLDNSDLPEPTEYFIDATLGTGGHSLEIVKRGGYVLGIDADEKMLKIAEGRLQSARPVPHLEGGGFFKLVVGNFKDIDTLAKTIKITHFDGVLFDLGVNSLHFMSPSRGFSFRNDSALLDMRLNKDSQSVTAADLLNGLRRDQLLALFSVTMEYKPSLKLTKKVLTLRKQKPFEKVKDLTDLLDKPRAGNKSHPATKAFLALRIAVNSELENLKEALPKAFGLLKGGGALVVISFHSGEDTIVKRFYKELVTSGQGKLANKKPITPSKEEVGENMLSRSAKLRSIIKKRDL